MGGAGAGVRRALRDLSRDAARRYRVARSPASPRLPGGRRTHPGARRRPSRAARCGDRGLPAPVRVSAAPRGGPSGAHRARRRRGDPDARPRERWRALRADARAGAARRPVRQRVGGAARRGARADPAAPGRRGSRDRGQSVLRARRDRLAGHRARPGAQRGGGPRRRGRQHADAAADEELLSQRGAYAPPQGDRARDGDHRRTPVRQARDLAALFERDLSRAERCEGHLRRLRGGAVLLRQGARGPHHRRVRAPRRADPRAERLLALPQPRARAQPPRSRAHRDGGRTARSTPPRRWRRAPSR